MGLRTLEEVVEVVEMIPVESSHIDGIGFDEEKSELHIRFTRPDVVTYVYYIVEKRVFEELLRSDSKGHYFNDHVKGEYPYRHL